ncbi:MAG: hypothetical protein Q4D96_11805 [Propionibacteriaceae bacterium]|nr:hypothetical protein [Propionibacteriaceae bacterium]
MDDRSWRWASEYGRDWLLKEAIENQALATQSLNRSMARQAKEFQNDLKAVRGNVEARLNALTNAFLNYVRLDDLEKQLQAFAGHPEARSHALRSIQRLASGQDGDHFADLPNYWLVPAVAALSPDGTLDESLAEQARQRNPEAARTFLTIAQGALGRGATVAHDLPSLLRPDEGHWARWQVLVWQAALLGAFGQGALDLLGGVVDEVLAGEQDWDAWAKRAMQASQSDKPALKRSTETFVSLSWVLDQFDQTTGSGPDPALAHAGPDFLPADSTPSAPEIDGEAEQEPANDPREVATTMLLEALTLRVVGSNDEEDELLAQAERTRQEFMQLLQRTPESSDSPVATTPALTAVQQMVTAPGVPTASRAWLWGRILPHFAPLAEQCGDGLAVPPTVPEITVSSGPKDLVVGPDGVQQPSQLKAARARIQEQSPQGILNHGIPVSTAGAVMMVLAVVLLTQNAGWGFLLLLVALVTLILGSQLLSRRRMAEEAVTAQLKSLDHKVEQATREATRQQEHDRAERERRQDLTTRFRAAHSSLRRHPLDPSPL